MIELHICDICGRSEQEVSQGASNDDSRFKRDEDGLWVCPHCQSNLITLPISQTENDDLDDKVKGLVGKSAGAICHTTNLPFVPPYQVIIEAASRIAYDENRYMSAWSFVTLWPDGTTVWQSADKSAKAIVSANGNVQIEEH